MTDLLGDTTTAAGSTVPPNTRLRLQRSQYEHTAQLVRRGKVWEPFTELKRIQDAVDVGVLDRNAAVQFVAKHIGFAEAFLVRHDKPMDTPQDQSEVRKYWKRLPRKLLTEAEARLLDEDCQRLRSSHPEGFAAATDTAEQAAKPSADRAAQ